MAELRLKALGTFWCHPGQRHCTVLCFTSACSAAYTSLGDVSEGHCCSYSMAESSCLPVVSIVPPLERPPNHPLFCISNNPEISSAAASELSQASLCSNRQMREHQQCMCGSGLICNCRCTLRHSLLLSVCVSGCPAACISAGLVSGCTWDTYTHAIRS